MMTIDTTELETPIYVVDQGLIRKNCEILRDVQEKTGCKVLLALKGFSMWSLFPLISQYLDGISASSLDEALLGYEEFDGELHLCIPAMKEAEFPKFLGMADHIVFNSFSQWQRFRDMALGNSKKISCAIRVNPGYSEVRVDKYNPCVRHSRLGVTRVEFREELLDGIEGLHFHALCEQNADTLERTLSHFEEQFGHLLVRMKWVNFGGGHHVTRKDYDVDRLCRLLTDFKQKYGVQVYIEPGEAIALNTGVLVASVLDIIRNEADIAILDTSAAAHMPDVLEMPYRPEIVGAGRPDGGCVAGARDGAGATGQRDEFPHTYLLGGNTCLAGDLIGWYSFPEPLKIGQKLIFADMAHYTMVKNNTFNGIRLPDIAIHDPDSGVTRVVRRFHHDDYKGRLS